ncbi:M12 family metallopeptidase [Aquimarina pacifica]|uniref:M12 family metallopeptidase n=1 Tax=Aquimarina pacifica TaxID=1296415 RepID=UPI0004B7019E|nr:M12 family metallopeptidase [Aquimarina pacifica]
MKIKRLKRPLLVVMAAIFMFSLQNCTKENSEDEIEENLISDFTQEMPELLYPNAVGEFISMGNGKSNDIQIEKINNEYVLSGDILLTEKQVDLLSKGHSLNKGTGLSQIADRWTNCTVYYTINASLPNQNRVTNAIAHWETNYPSIDFIPRSNQTNYIEFSPGGGCGSSLGMIGGRQLIILADGCSTGNTIHEIGHALGLLHEQQRADRDDSIIINWDNIIPIRVNNFRTYTETGIAAYETGNFDFNSIMMYGSGFFSSNGLPTITRLDGSTFNIQRNGLSAGDLEMIEDMYGCFSSKLEISGSSPICSTSSLTYSLDGNTNNSPVNWSVSSNLQILSSSNTSITIQAANSFVNGEALIEAQIAGLTVSKNVWIGKPRVPTNITFYSSSPCLNQNVIALLQANNPEYAGVHYEWRGGSHSFVDQNPEGTEVHFRTYTRFPYTSNIFVKATNDCGSSSEYYEVISVVNCGGSGDGPGDGDGPAPEDH